MLLGRSKISLLSKISLILFSLLPLCSCLYEDQVGKFDWLQNYIGRLKFVVSEPSGRRVVIGTEKNVLAALSMKTGQIIWRQVLERERNGHIHFLTAASSGESVIITGEIRGLVRGFDSSTGSLAWEWTLPAIINLDRVFWTVKNERLYAVLPDMDHKFSVHAFNLRSGGSSGSWEVNATWNANNKCLLSGEWIACASPTFIHLTSITQPELSNTIELENVGASLSSFQSGDISALITRYDSDGQNYGRVIILSGSGEPHTCNQSIKPGASVRLIPSNGANRKILLLQLVRINQASYWEVSDCISGKIIDELSGPVQWPISLGTPFIAEIMCTSKKDDLSSCKFLLHTDDHAILAMQYPGKILWTREEALASISIVEMLDLPVSDTDAAIEKEFDNKEGEFAAFAGVFGMFGRRLVSQVMQLQHLLQTVFGIQEPNQPSGQRADLVRDEFGLHKMIIVATEASKVYGIDNLNGDIVWVQRLHEVDTTSMQLFVQRTTRRGPFSAQCSLLLKDRDSDTGILYTFNPITGIGKMQHLRYQVIQAMLLPATDTESLRPIMLMDAMGRVHVEPPSAQHVALAIAPSLYLYVANSTSGIMAGYSLAQSTSTDLVTSKVWEIVFQPETQKLFRIVGKNPQERVHSQGRVLADRSVLYKYVNPNLVAVVTLGNDPVHKYVLNLYLVDAVSGAVIFSVSHKRARKPIHIVHSENWIVYSYFSEKWRRTEIAAIELYEGKTQSSTGSFSSLMNPIQPLVERQSYILPAMVQSMQPTVTEKGITSRHILVGLSSGAVLELPWMYVDPRRPLTATAEMREEGVIPYMPELPIPADAVINYNQSLPLISGIHTSPSGLESTSLVLIYGLDLFYTRVAPSKTFDLLKEDFDPFLISMVLVGLALASYTTKRLASRKALKQAWK